jgi:hypothetical protein
VVSSTAMNETVATIIGILALLGVCAIPVVIFRLVQRSNERALAAVDAWARTKGLDGTKASAAGGVHPSVRVLNFVRGRDLVSLAVQVSSRFRYFIIYVQPHELRLPALGLQRRMMGGGEPLGDPALDDHYRLLHGGAPALALLRAPEVYETFAHAHSEVQTLYVHKGVLILTFHYHESIDPSAWDDAWDLTTRLLAAGEQISARGRAGVTV